MARYKDTEKGQGLFLTVDLEEQIVEDTYEYTLMHLIDNIMDLTIFDTKYNNDETGAKAIKPKILLKIILYCYSMGIISSRKIAKLCETHMTVKALAEDTEPHYTTISDFVSGMSGEIEKVFAEVLIVCNEMKLIGGRMFAIDGCKLPSNASKEWSGTKEELTDRYDKLKETCKKILKKHRMNDRLGSEELAADRRKLEKLRKKADRIAVFLMNNEERLGASGEVVKSNVTDNESGKIKCSDGVIQGYNGMAVADSKNQIIVAANAYGSVAEGQYFPGLLDRTEENMSIVTGKENPLEGTVMLGDNGYFSEDNFHVAAQKGMEAIIPDEQFRNRDKDLKDGKRRCGKERFDTRHFIYNKQGNYYTCPNGKKLMFRTKTKLKRTECYKYESKASDCKDCPYKGTCIRPGKKEKGYRTLLIKIPKYGIDYCRQMREKIDKPKYKKIYSQRLGIIEPVFANITYCKGIDRFTLRTQQKVMIQWLLYCIVHNIGKCKMA